MHVFAGCTAVFRGHSNLLTQMLLLERYLTFYILCSSAKPINVPFRLSDVQKQISVIIVGGVG